MQLKLALFFLVIFCTPFTVYSQTLEPKKVIEVNGVFPQLTIMGPMEERSESGIGALIPWADKLWMIGYVAHIHGSRLELYEIDENLQMKKHEQSITGTFANRMVHKKKDIAIIGPHFIQEIIKYCTVLFVKGLLCVID